MAEFDKAFAKTMGHEGGYVDDPDDPGGETYRGIARRYHPGWAGWSKIDRLKRKNDFPRNLKNQEALDDLVEDFFKQRYWDPFQGDGIPNQRIGNELFDTGVNLGMDKAVTFLQMGLNFLNRNGRSYPDISEDGDLGPKSLSTLKTLLQLDRKPDHLLKIMNLLQGSYYLEKMKDSPVKEKYARGWLTRVSISRKPGLIR